MSKEFAKIEPTFTRDNRKYHRLSPNAKLVYLTLWIMAFEFKQEVLLFDDTTVNHVLLRTGLKQDCIKKCIQECSEVADVLSVKEDMLKVNGVRKLHGNYRRFADDLQEKWQSMGQEDRSQEVSVLVSKERRGEENKRREEKRTIVQPNPLERKCEEIYEAYPRRVGKKKALASIKSALKEKDFAFLLERVQTFARAVDGQEEKWIPLPTTWFDQGRYDDDEAMWSAWNKPSETPWEKKAREDKEQSMREYEEDLAAKGLKREDIDGL